jgi:hypothetical protein
LRGNILATEGARGAVGIALAIALLETVNGGEPVTVKKSNLITT